MDQKQIFKQMIDFNKALFENTFNSMASLQEQAETLGSMFIEQAPWIPGEGKKVVNDWVGACKKGRENFKKAVDDGFKKAESLMGYQQ